MKIPTFFGQLLGAGVSLMGMKKEYLDDSAVKQQMQNKQIAAQRQGQSASLTQRASESDLASQQSSARQRVEALDRVIGTFQKNLRIR